MVEGSGFRRTGQRQASESVSTAATTSPDDKDVRRGVWNCNVAIGDHG